MSNQAHKCETEHELDHMLLQFCQRIEDLTGEKLALCDINDALAAENIALRKELAAHRSTVEAKRQRFSEVSASIGREAAE